MNKNLGVLLAIFALVIPSTSLADSKFDGFYAGLNAGYVDGKDKGKEYWTGEVWEGVASGYTQKTTPNAFAFGAFAGFNKVFENNVLLGLEADYEYRNGSDKSFQKDEEGVTDTLYVVKTKLRDAGSVRARFGYVFNEGITLGYITAGYAAARIKRTYYDYEDSEYSSNSKWHDGWTAGLGGEHFVNEKLSLKADYRYSSYGRETVYAESYRCNEKQKYQDEQSVRVGISYHF